MSKTCPFENTIPGEEWRCVPDYEGIYWISSLGRFCNSVKLFTGGDKSREYVTKNLTKDGVCRRQDAHRLVALAFIPNPDNLPYVNHKNQDKKDNRVENLEWIDNRANVLHGYLPEHRYNTSTKRDLLSRGTPVVSGRTGKVYSSLKQGCAAEGSKVPLHRIVAGRSWRWRLATHDEKFTHFPDLYKKDWNYFVKMIDSCSEEDIFALVNITKQHGFK